MKQTIALLTLLGLAACGGGPGLQIAAPHPAFIAKGRPGLHVAAAALEGGLPETALAITRSLLETDPRDAAALVAQGDALTALDRADAAGESYRRALAVDPQSGGALLAVGRLRLAAGQPAEAEALFRRLVATAPSNAQAQNNLGIALDMQEHHSQAQAAYQAALQSAPEMTAAKVNLALSYTLSGEPGRAPPPQPQPAEPTSATILQAAR